MHLFIDELKVGPQLIASAGHVPKGLSALDRIIAANETQ